MSLDFKPAQFKAFIERSADIINQWYAKGLRGGRIYRNYTPKEIQHLFDEALPQTGTEVVKLLEQIETVVFETSNFNPSPNYYGYITGGGNQVAILAELLRNALNQNNLKWHSAPANSEIEKIVIKWICQFIGYPENSTGVLASGGSVGNFLNLAVMRKAMCPVDMAEEGMYSAPKMTVYVSEQGHSSIDKGMDMLGLGRKYLRKIRVNNQFQIELGALEEQIIQDRARGLLPVCIIGIAGTTNTGSIDPLKELGHIAKRHKMWYYIDGAYGLPGAGTQLVGASFEGLELADAILINPHKWFFVPFEVAAVIVKQKQYLKDAFSYVPDYLKAGAEVGDREDLMDFNLQLTKDFKALKVWMTFKAYGAEKLGQAIENDCQLARYAKDYIERSPLFEMLAPVPLSIVCFRYLGRPREKRNDEQYLDKLNDALLEAVEADGRVFFAGTKINGRTALRINLTNHRRTKEDIGFLFKVLKELGEHVESNGKSMV